MPLVAFLAPFLLWLYFAFPFLQKNQLGVFEDARYCFMYTHFFLNHIARGVYPLWNPFSHWGRPDDYFSRLIGDMNPFLYLSLWLNKLGIAFPVAYFIYLIVYFAVGMLGFYLLSKKLLNNRFWAWVAYLLLLFSNLGTNIFNNIIVILIFVPTVWFFYFLVSFLQSYHKKFALGLTFSLMILLTTYMPFHFLAIFIAFLLLSCLIYVRNLKEIFMGLGKFIIKHKLISALCLLSLGLAALPGLNYYLDAQQHALTYSWRGEAQGNNAIAMDKNMILVGNAVSLGILKHVWGNLKDLSLQNFYVPVFIFCSILAGLILPLTKRRTLLSLLAYICFILSLTSITPLYEWLYDHVFFFKFFRNAHFFIWAVTPLAILVICDVLKELSERSWTKPLKTLLICWIFVTHSLFVVYLSSLWGISWITYLSVVLSALLLIALILKSFSLSSKRAYIIISLVLLLQPLYVFLCIKNNAHCNGSYSAYMLNAINYKPQFNWLRPRLNEDNTWTDTYHTDEYRDRSGFVNDFFYGAPGARFLHDHYQNRLELENYVRHKFIFYPLNMPLMKQGDSIPQGEFVEGPSQRLNVIDFDLNYIHFKTQLDQAQWLVYNDGYDTRWRASIDGKPQKITMANLGFKSIQLPAGTHDVVLVFSGHFRPILMLSLIVYFHCFLAFTIFNFILPKDPTIKHDI